MAAPAKATTAAIENPISVFFSIVSSCMCAGGRLERVRFELNHDSALSFCFDAFSSNAFSSEVDTGSHEENAFFYHLERIGTQNRYPLSLNSLP
jgi:hypothetical protein